MNNAITKELKDNGVMVLTLNRPEVLNAMNRDLIMGLYETFQELENLQVQDLKLLKLKLLENHTLNQLMKEFNQKKKYRRVLVFRRPAKHAMTFV